MEKIQFNLPDMWADHHVLKVREIVTALGPGVQNVVASSAFRVVAVEYDPAAISPAAIEAALVTGGYPIATQPGTVNPVPVQVRSGDASWGRQGFRTARTDARDTKTAR